MDRLNFSEGQGRSHAFLCSIYLMAWLANGILHQVFRSQVKLTNPLGFTGEWTSHVAKRIKKKKKTRQDIVTQTDTTYKWLDLFTTWSSSRLQSSCPDPRCPFLALTHLMAWNTALMSPPSPLASLHPLTPSSQPGLRNACKNLTRCLNWELQS